MTSLFEPYVQLVDVTATAALVAWGGFVLEEHGGSWRARRTGETFGVRSVPIGRAAVEVLDGDGAVVAREATDDVNHVWVEGLRPLHEPRNVAANAVLFGLAAFVAVGRVFG